MRIKTCKIQLNYSCWLISVFVKMFSKLIGCKTINELPAGYKYILVHHTQACSPTYIHQNEKLFENIVGKGQNAYIQHFLVFPHYFLPFQTLCLSISPFPNKPWFLRVCNTSILKTHVGKGESACKKQFLLIPQ